MKLGNFYITVSRKSALIFPMIVFVYTLLYIIFNERPFWGEALLMVRLVFLCIFISLLFILREEVKISKIKQQENIDQDKNIDISEIKKVFLLIISITIYLFVLNRLGFIISSYLLMLSVMYLLGEKNWRILLLIPLAITMFIYLMFQVWLLVPLPQGIFGF